MFVMNDTDRIYISMLILVVELYMQFNLFMLLNCGVHVLILFLLQLTCEFELQADMDIISLAYDSFLSRFPLCHWHLEKYAYQKAKFCNSQEAANIFEQAVEVAMYSVGFWAEYFTFAATCFGSPVDIRRYYP